MCFTADAVLNVAFATSLYRRWYQDSAVAVELADRQLVSTPGQPLLTHRGWVSASAVQQGDYLVTADCLEAATDATIDDEWFKHVLTPNTPTVHLRCPPHGFWGDAGAAATVEVLGSVHGGPLVASGGEEPDVDHRLVWRILAHLSRPEAFGVPSWVQALARVPDLGRVWPDGEPTARGNSLSPVARARLGRAVLELPEPPQERYPEWVLSLLGRRTDLGLVRVDRSTRLIARGWVFNAACRRSAFVANGLVVGSSA